MRPYRQSANMHKTPRRRCPFSGKYRFRDEAAAKAFVTNAQFQRNRLMNEIFEYGWCGHELPRCYRNEVRPYHCTGCGGWHTTSRAYAP